MINLKKVVWYHNWCSWNIAVKKEESWEKTDGDFLTVPKNFHGFVILSHSLIYTHMQYTQRVNPIHLCKELVFWNCVIPAPKTMFSCKWNIFSSPKICMKYIYLYYAFQIKIPNHWKTMNKWTELLCSYLNYWNLISLIMLV